MKLINTATETYADFGDEIAAGMEYLDANEGGWEQKIDLSTLTLSSICNCILGQIQNACNGGLYSEYLNTNLSDAGRFAKLKFAQDHGFAMCTPRWHQYTENGSDIHDFFWSQLDNQWIAAIKDRFNSGNLSESENK